MKIFKLFLAASLLPCALNAQKQAPNGWHLLDKAKSGCNGISLNEAYDFLKAKNLTSQNVVVAVIDSGIDTLHEDLKPILWTNPKEIAGNGVDDDKNGYIDDVHGYNYIGGRDGRNVSKMSYEVARVYFMYKSKFENKTINDVADGDKEDFKMWERAAKELNVGESSMALIELKSVIIKTKEADVVLQKALKKKVYTKKMLMAYKPNSEGQKEAKRLFLDLMKEFYGTKNNNETNLKALNEAADMLEKTAATKNTAPEDTRALIVKDDASKLDDLNYGNTDLMAETSFHGTHCSGIIGAVRTNNKGINGIADNVSIMMLRAVPDGDEHDKDIANAIRYAVDNGAKIISMSFGKNFSPYKKWVDDAVKYAEDKNVLLVHAAGNDGKDLDTEFNFPCAQFTTGYRPKNFITVGASAANNNGVGALVASFSNFGKKEVDVFAPGVNIYSAVPGGNTYDNASGTSMACPVVAGIAALLLEYFPKLTAVQLKSIIEKSAIIPKEKVSAGYSGNMVNLADISVTGGVANAFEAVKMAASTN